MIDWQAVGQVVGGIFAGIGVVGGLLVPLVLKLRKELIAPAPASQGESLREVVNRIDKGVTHLSGRVDGLAERVAVLEDHDAEDHPSVQH